MKKLILILSCMMLFMAYNNSVNATVNDTIVKTRIELSKNDSAKKTVSVENSGPDNFKFDYRDFNLAGGERDTNFIATFAIFCVFIVPALMVIAIVAITQSGKRKREKAKYELMEKALTSGRDIPIDFFKEAMPRKNYLQQGISLTAISFGLFLFLFFAVDEEVSTIACIPFFIGAGKIIIHFLNNREEKSQSHEIEQ